MRRAVFRREEICIQAADLVLLFPAINLNTAAVLLGVGSVISTIIKTKKYSLLPVYWVLSTQKSVLIVDPESGT